MRPADSWRLLLKNMCNSSQASLTVTVPTRPNRFVVLTTLLFAMGACLSARGHGNGRTNSAATWAALEEKALAKARTRQNDELGSPRRVLADRDFQQDVHLTLKGGRCHEIVLAWSFALKVTPKVLFKRGPDGTIANDTVSHLFLPDLGPEVGGMRFCTDNDGEVIIQLRPVIAVGHQLTVKPEYVIVASSSPETSTEREARRAADRVEAKQHHAAFVEESESRAADRVADRMAKMCRACRRERYDCRDSTSSCDRRYRSCIAGGVELQPGETKTRIDCSQVP